MNYQINNTNNLLDCYYKEPQAYLPESEPIVHMLEPDLEYLNPSLVNMQKTLKRMKKQQQIYLRAAIDTEYYENNYLSLQVKVTGSFENSKTKTCVDYP